MFIHCLSSNVVKANWSRSIMLIGTLTCETAAMRRKMIGEFQVLPHSRVPLYRMVALQCLWQTPVLLLSYEHQWQVSYTDPIFEAAILIEIQHNSIDDCSQSTKIARSVAHHAIIDSMCSALQCGDNDYGTRRGYVKLEHGYQLEMNSPREV